MLFLAIMNLHLDFEASLLASSSNKKIPALEILESELYTAIMK
jgi:hypothetical protein